MNSIYIKDRLNKQLYLYITVLIGVDIFGLFFMPKPTPVILVPFSLYFFVLNWEKELLFKGYIVAFLIFAFASCISCYYYRNQPIIESLTCPAFREYYLLLTYFIYVSLRPKPQQIEKVIIVTFAIFFVIYFVQYLVFPREFVHIIAGRRTERIRMIGQIVNSLAFFLSLNRWMLNKGSTNIIVMVCCVFVFFSLGFRAMFAAVLLSSSIMFFKIRGFDVKKLLAGTFVALVLGGAFSLTPVAQKGIERMVNAQETDTYENEDYIRWIQWEYYLNSHFKSETERIFGSGQPGYDSVYGREMNSARDTHIGHVLGGIHDWGLIGQSWVVGPFTIVIFVLMMLRCIWISWKSDNQYFYIASWYIFLILISTTNMEVHRQGSMAYHALIFYLVTILNHKQWRIRKIASLLSTLRKA